MRHRATWGILLALVLFLSGCGRATTASAAATVVVYVSEDQVFSEPILRGFEADTGIRVRAVYDTEEAKSTGVTNRLIAEQTNPQADVYWANEPIRAEVLKRRGVSAAYRSPSAEGIPPAFRDPSGHWTGFSARLRVLLAHRNLPRKPASLRDYADARWKGRAAIANPQFGTTTSEVAALFALWGDERARAFMESLKRNETRISSDNGESADLVARGDCDFALVDSDDAFTHVRRGDPVDLILPDQGKDEPGCLVVPNAVLLVQGAPHADAGRRLVDYLLSRETERKLADADCRQLPLHPGLMPPPGIRSLQSLKCMPADYAKVADRMQAMQPFLKEWSRR